VSERLFVALELPAAVRAALAARGEELVAADAGLRAVRGESLHVTLCFLGDADPDLVRRLVAPEIRPVGALELATTRRRAHVVAVEVADPSGSLTALRARIAAALVAGAGYVDDHPRFWAHVTVARARGGATRRVDPFRPLPAPAAAEFRPEAVALYRSRLAPGGSRYEPLERWKVGARSLRHDETGGRHAGEPVARSGSSPRRRPALTSWHASVRLSRRSRVATVKASA